MPTLNFQSLGTGSSNGRFTFNVGTYNNQANNRGCYVRIDSTSLNPTFNRAGWISLVMNTSPNVISVTLDVLPVIRSRPVAFIHDPIYAGNIIRMIFDPRPFIGQYAYEFGLLVG